MPAINRREFRRILRQVCDAKTSYYPKRWKPENPLYGHCTVASLLAQDVYGGELLRVSLLSGDWHWWNLLPNGREVDFTREQYGKDFPVFPWPEVRERKPLLARSASVAQRYRLLKKRFQQALAAR